MARLPLTIVRNQGYELKGSEKHRRLVAANTLMMEINEYQFFHFPEAEQTAHFLFEFIEKQYLILAQDLIREVVEPKYPELSDRKLAFIGIMLALAMERVATGFSVEEESYPSQINKDLLKVAKQIFAQVAEQTKRLYSVNEIVFLRFY